MGILNGWKEIAQCLNLTSRTAQRWERLGLPVRRVSNSRRSPIVAVSDEIENWVRKKNTKLDGLDSLAASTMAFQATKRETRKLIKQLKEARLELRRQLNVIHNQIDMDRAPSADNPGKFPKQKS